MKRLYYPRAEVTLATLACGEARGGQIACTATRKHAQVRKNLDASRASQARQDVRLTSKRISHSITAPPGVANPLQQRVSESPGRRGEKRGVTRPRAIHEWPAAGRKMGLDLLPYPIGGGANWSGYSCQTPNNQKPWCRLRIVHISNAIRTGRQPADQTVLLSDPQFAPPSALQTWKGLQRLA